MARWQGNTTCAVGNVPPNDPSLEQDLRMLQGKRIYFGHQSVGGNVLEGLRDILAEHDDLQMKIVASLIGQNGAPYTKCAAFRQALDWVGGDAVDIALMKFCYVDFNSNTDIERLFASYKEAIAEIKSKHPRVNVIPVTAPLTVRPSLCKRVAKIVLGRADDSAANSKRSEFNGLLRCYYAGQPIYDLAQVESTYPDGTRSSFGFGGQTAHSLISDYASDSGHLNEVGRRIAARELIRTLARSAVTKST